ncbi:MAG: hypothetical protein U0361_03645 [Nitrospiraceae bacterium]
MGIVDYAVRAMKAGAFDFVTKPFEPETVAVIVKKALDVHRHWRRKIISFSGSRSVSTRALGRHERSDAGGYRILLKRSQIAIARY